MSVHLTIRTRPVLSVSVLFLFALLIGVADLLGLCDTNHAHEQTSTSRFPSAFVLDKFDLSLTRARTALDKAMLYPDDKGAIQLLDRTEELIVRSDEAQKKYLLLPCDDEEERLTKDVTTRRDMASASLRDIIRTLRAGDCATVDKIMEKGVSKVLRDANDSSLALSKKQLAFSKASHDEPRDVYACFHLIMIAAIVLALAVVP